MIRFRLCISSRDATEVSGEAPSQCIMGSTCPFVGLSQLLVSTLFSSVRYLPVNILRPRDYLTFSQTFTIFLASIDDYLNCLSFYIFWFAFCYRGNFLFSLVYFLYIPLFITICLQLRCLSFLFNLGMDCQPVFLLLQHLGLD